jgi:hypothetical protein
MFGPVSSAATAVFWMPEDRQLSPVAEFHYLLPFVLLNKIKLSVHCIVFIVLLGIYSFGFVKE